jgi:hypothetical protein
MESAPNCVDLTSETPSTTAGEQPPPDGHDPLDETWMPYIYGNLRGITGSSSAGNGLETFTCTCLLNC